MSDTVSLKVLDLFSGIGGFSEGLERTGGFETVQFCEIDPYCQRVLRKHWPEVPIHDDIKTLFPNSAGAQCPGKTGGGNHCEGRSTVRFDGGSRPAPASALPAIDVITGGFPCQDLSLAGAQAGIDGARSGLWAELARVIGHVRPRYAVLENVSALVSGDRGRWFGRVLGDLAAIGYDAEWHCIQAADVGAPHIRDRVWVIAYPSSSGVRQQPEPVTGRGVEAESEHNGAAWNVADARCPPPQVPLARRLATIKKFERASWWTTEPDVDRVAHGIPKRVDRLRGLGNAIVPQIAELIGQAILASDIESAA